MNRYVSLALFVVGVVGIGLLIGYATLPGEWYAGLAKPSFNPPNWVFAPTWSLLYVLIAIAGWRTWRQSPTGRPMNLWWAQTLLNFLWSPAFFGAQQIGVALAVIVLLLASILAFIALRWKQDRLSALLFVPYAAWVSFATLLNASIWRLN